MSEKYPNRFKPGQSGNPSGRPKRTQEERDALEMLRTLAPDAVHNLVQIIHDKKISINAKLKAIELVLDRVYGKPATNGRFVLDAKLPEIIRYPDGSLEILKDDDLGDFVLRIEDNYSEGFDDDTSGYAEVGEMVGGSLSLGD